MSQAHPSQTPNIVLRTEDIPPPDARDIENDVSYPQNSRYTVQWLVIPPDKSTERRLRNNSDATFKNHDLPKPADLILHYNYGAAAVRCWGRNQRVLERPDVPRPERTSLPIGRHGPGSHDRELTIQKREKRKRDGDEDDGRRPGPSGNRAEEPEAKRRRDEDDVILYYWGNSKAARERHARKEDERRDYLEKWRSSVSDELSLVEGRV